VHNAAESKIKRMKQRRAKNEEELESLRKLKARISELLGGMNIPFPHS
jgi:hypothetical protein